MSELLQIEECPACEGRGFHAHRVTVYEHGCGFPHDDTEEVPCANCGGTGELVIELEPDPPAEHPPFRHFTDEESAAWDAVFLGVFCPICDVWLGSAALFSTIHDEHHKEQP